jgi:hypothetical protein
LLLIALAHQSLRQPRSDPTKAAAEGKP